ncbi:hypothetical protein F5Y03DRAFT_410642 [Xylaria venustula]|nr:hypothetical protein F5Y03DRAFT_410642 [Xylaria venustula]
MSKSQEGTASDLSSHYSCSLCHKTFEHETSAKRHYYYCRSKPTDTKGSRKKSCVACVRAKTRCVWRSEAGQSDCVRCNKRNVICEYDTTVMRTTVPEIAFEESSSATIIQHDLSDAVLGTSTTLASTRTPPDDEAMFFSAFNQTSIDLGIATDLTFLDSPSFTLDDLGFEIEELPVEVTKSMSVACSTIAKLSSTTTSPPPPWAYQLPNTPLFSVRTFTRPDHLALQTIAMRILKSYPSMVAKGTLPPFIHFSASLRPKVGHDNKPHKVSSLKTSIPPTYTYYHAWLSQNDAVRRVKLNGTYKGSTPSLADCWNLVQSFASQTATSKGSWMWGQIWYEQQRILSEYSSFDRWELLDALQTLLIFCLLRLQDAPVGHAVFDVSLLTTVNLVSQALGSSVSGTLDCSISEDPAVAWEDWIFIESRRRTVLVFQILGLLVDISTAVTYFSIGGLVLVPLPSSAALWSTQDFERWKPEYRKWYKDHTMYGLSDTGGLTWVESKCGEIKAGPAEWEVWSAEVGDISTLVMIIGEILRNQ